MPSERLETSRAARSAREALAVYTERPTLMMMALGFAAGLPFLLIFDTLSAWLRDEGLTLEVIGFFSLATLVYSFKFLWAPLIDRTRVPWLTTWLGHRRSWMLACQALIIGGLGLLAGRDPVEQLGLMAVLAVLVGFCSATQDIAIDAWRIEVADESRQGALAAAYQWGYRVATLVAGAVPLLLAESYGWNLSYGVMAGLMGLGVLATLGAPPEAQHTIRQTHVEGLPYVPVRDGLEWTVRLGMLGGGALILGSGLAANASVLADVVGRVGMAGVGERLLAAWQAPAGIWVQMLAVLLGFGVIVVAVCPIPGTRTRPSVYLASALGEPLGNFFARYGRRAGPILALICLYRLSDFLLNIMNPFFLDLGFTLTEVGRGPQGVWCGGVDDRRVRRRVCHRTLWPPAVAARRRTRRPAQQPDIRVAGNAGPRPRRPVRGHRRGERAQRLCRYVSDCLHVQPDCGWLHRHAIRPLLVPVRATREDPRLSIRPHRRGRSPWR